jgi:uncharacterized protein involved in response to NO
MWRREQLRTDVVNWVGADASAGANDISALPDGVLCAAPAALTWNASSRALAASALVSSRWWYVVSNIVTDVPAKRATSDVGTPAASAHEIPEWRSVYG